MKRFILSFLLVASIVMDTFAYKSDEQLQKDDDSAGLIGIIISIVIIVVYVITQKENKDK